MKIFKLITLIIVLISSASISLAQESISMEDLLNKVKAGRSSDSADNQKREDIMSRQSIVSTMISGWRMFKDNRDIDDGH